MLHIGTVLYLTVILCKHIVMILHVQNFEKKLYPIPEKLYLRKST